MHAGSQWPFALYVPGTDIQTPLSRIPTTDPKALSNSLTTFSSFLTTIDVSSSPRLALLSSGALAEKIHRTALRRIAQAYSEVCEKVLDKKEGYEFGETLLRRSAGEVGVALGVDGDLELGDGDEMYDGERVGGEQDGGIAGAGAEEGLRLSVGGD
jgi:hypothetical protein